MSLPADEYLDGGVRVECDLQLDGERVGGEDLLQLLIVGGGLVHLGALPALALLVGLLGIGIGVLAPAATAIDVLGCNSIEISGDIPKPVPNHSALNFEPEMLLKN